MFQNRSTDSTFLSVAFQIVKAALAAVAACVVGAFVFAIVLRFSAIPDRAILPVNETLKVVAIFFGAMLFIKGEKGLLKGALTGVFTVALSYLAFSALGGDFSLSWLIFAELFFGAVVGGASGVAAVNFKS
ncbi:MAG: TIGR04086 family membrane protein [Clostridia bacterium]|nr:TIGR04086 family membrane protein [Clostridia bacterium]